MRNQNGFTLIEIAIVLVIIGLLLGGVLKGQELINSAKVKNLANVEVLVVSMDLPFAQKRWCGAEGVENVKTLSAHRCTDFGYDYGVLISGGPLDRCLSRAMFVVDPNGKVTHVEYCAEIAEHPNYDAALAAAKK